MNTEAQRIAIAELCGWHGCYPTNEGPMGFFRDRGVSEDLPDYPGDLNAMHEAESVFDEGGEHWEKWFEWIESLMKACSTRDLVSEPFLRQQAGWRVVARATAAQRAEAFLRTFNKWIPQ